MPHTIIDRYQLECLSCNYVWDTKYPKISAKCPSCTARIYDTENYKVHTKYIHHESTEEEKRTTGRVIGIIILVFLVFISLIVKWYFGFFLFLAIIGILIYLICKDVDTQDKHKT